MGLEGALGYSAAADRILRDPVGYLGIVIEGLAADVALYGVGKGGGVNRELVLSCLGLVRNQAEECLPHDLAVPLRPVPDAAVPELIEDPGVIGHAEEVKPSCGVERCLPCQLLLRSFVKSGELLCECLGEPDR